MANTLLLKIKVDDKGNLALVKLGKNLDKVKKKTSETGKVFKGVFAANVLSRTIGLATRAFTRLVGEGLKFQDTFKKVEGITRTTGKALQSLKERALEVSNGSEFMASAVAEATLQISKMGLTTEESIQVIPKVMDLATAGIARLEEAAELTVQTLKSFDLEASETDRVVTALFTSISNTAIGFEDLKEALKFVAPIAAKMNVPLEETVALIGALGDVGLKGSVGGTSLKNMLLNLLKPSKEVAAQIKAMNLEGKNLATILGEIKDKFGDSTLERFMETFNLRALTGALAVSGMGGEIQKLINIMKTQKDITAKAANVMRDSMINQFRILEGAILNVSTQFVLVLEKMNASESVVKDLTKVFLNLQEEIRDNGDEIRDFIDKLAKFARDVLAIVVPTIKFLAKNFDTLAIAAKGFFILFTAGKVASVVAGMGKLAAGAGTLKTAFGPISLVLIGISAAIDEIVRAEETLAKLKQSQNKKEISFELDALQDKITATEKFLKIQERLNIAEAKFSKTKQDTVFLRQDDQGLTNILLAQNKFASELGKLSKDSGFSKQFFKLMDKSIPAFIANFKAQLQKAQISSFTEEVFKSKRGEKKIGPDGFDAQSTARTFTEGLKDASERALIDKKELAETEKTRIKNKKIQERITKDRASFLADTILDLRRHGINLQSVMDQVTNRVSDKEGVFSVFEADIKKALKLASDSKVLLAAAKDPAPVKPAAQIHRNLVLQGKEGLLIKLGIFKQELSLEEDFAIALVRVKKDLQAKIEVIDKVASAKREEALAKAVAQKKDIAMQFVNFADEQANTILNAVAANISAREQLELAAISKRERALNREEATALNAFKGSAEKQAIIRQQFEAKRKQLDEQREKAEEVAARKRKVIALAQVAINTAIGVTNALAYGAPVVKWVEAALVAASGVIQAGIISSQNLRHGGFVGGAGNGTSDSNLVSISRGEAVTSNDTLSRLGGRSAFTQLIDENIDNGLNPKTSGTTIIIEGNVIGNREFIHELADALDLEDTRRF